MNRLPSEDQENTSLSRHEAALGEDSPLVKYLSKTLNISEKEVIALKKSVIEMGDDEAHSLAKEIMNEDVEKMPSEVTDCAMENAAEVMKEWGPIWWLLIKPLVEQCDGKASVLEKLVLEAIITNAQACLAQRKIINNDTCYNHFMLAVSHALVTSAVTAIGIKKASS